MRCCIEIVFLFKLILKNDFQPTEVGSDSVKIGEGTDGHI